LQHHPDLQISALVGIKFVIKIKELLKLQRSMAIHQKMFLF